RFMHSIDMVDLKDTASKNPAEGRVLQLIFELKARKVAWKLGGTTPNEGFDSPSFAAYVLQSLHLITSDKHSSQADLCQKIRLLLAPQLFIIIWLAMIASWEKSSQRTKRRPALRTTACPLVLGNNQNSD